MPREYNPQWTQLEKALGTRPLLVGSVEEIGEQYNGLLGLLAGMMPLPEASVTTNDEKINDSAIVRVYHPEEARARDQKLPLGVYAHGGGYCCGTLDAEDAICRAIAKLTPCIVVSVDYRLGPTHKMPVMLDDFVAAYDWAWRESEKLGADRQRYFSCGSSAGGGLALGLAEKLISSGSRDRIRGIAALVPVTLHYSNVPEEYKSMYKSYEEYDTSSPVINGQTMGSWFAAIEPDITDSTQFPALSKNLSQYPPTYIMTCEMDPLRDDGAVMKQALEKAGIKVKYDHYEGYPHYFWIFPSITDGQKVIENLIAGIRFILTA